MRALYLRFCPTAYDDPMEILNRLRQVSSVATYKGQFEALSSRIQELSEKQELNCSFSGLRDEIRLRVRMLNPPNLSAAFGLAKIQEEYRPWNESSRMSILGLPPMIKNEGRGAK